MEQQQFRVPFPLGTKLLLSLVILLAMVIVFLNLSAILLLKEDKKAYIYQTQSTSAVLVGREFSHSAQRTLDTLRLAIAAVDPFKPLLSQDQVHIQNIVNNQSEIVYLSLAIADTLTGKTKSLASFTKEKEFKELVLIDQADRDELIKPLLKELLEHSYAFYNPSQAGGSPVLGVVLADLKSKRNDGFMPIAFGVTSLNRDFKNDLGPISFAITTQFGRLLFDTDPEVFYSKKNLFDDPLFQASKENQVSSGTFEFEQNGEKYLGSFVKTELDFLVLNRIQWKKAIRATYRLTEKFILLGVMAISIGIFFSIFFSKTLTASLGKLYNATAEIAKGNFNINLAIKSRDEIGALTGAFNVMSEKIGDLIDQIAEKIHLENEVAIASTVQEQLLPGPTFKNENLFIRSFYMSASQCGGDWWGFFNVGKKTCVMIADATGHGLPSALITASARSCFSMIEKIAQEDPDFKFSPSEMLSYANRVIYDASFGKIMMTFFIGVIDFEKKIITYSSAGHNPPWLFKKTESQFTLKSMTAVGSRLGEAKNSPGFEEKTESIDHSDILVLYTDGLIEGKNDQGAPYGKKRMRKMIENSLKGGPDEVVNGLVGDFFRHNAEKPLDDDITIAAIQFNGSL